MISTCIIIPLHRERLTETEKISLRQCAVVFAGYPIVLIGPKKNDYAGVLALVGGSAAVTVETFDDMHFGSIDSYSRLLLTRQFYERFSGYEYVLIHHLDAFAFRDELPFWVSQGYSYLGPPWFEGYNEGDAESDFIEYGGNGGFSLRHVKSFLMALDSFRAIRDPFAIYRAIGNRRKTGRLKLFPAIVLKMTGLRKYTDALIEKLGIYEDIFWSSVAPAVDPGFRVARFDVEIRFAFECQPSRLYEMNGRRLPFGCHAWEKYEPDFWAPFIRKCGYTL